MGFAPTKAAPTENSSASSAIFTAEDLAAAEARIREEFDTWGCELHSLQYAGDICCNRENLDWMNDLGDGETFTQCAEFLSDFHSPAEGGGAWEPDFEYTDWQWWLARTEGGDWEIVDWGYGAGPGSAEAGDWQLLTWVY